MTVEIDKEGTFSCEKLYSVSAGIFEKSALVHRTILVNMGSFSGKNVNFADSFYLRLTKRGPLCHVENSTVSQQWSVLAYFEKRASVHRTIHVNLGSFSGKNVKVTHSRPC